MAGSMVDFWLITIAEARPLFAVVLWGADCVRSTWRGTKLSLGFDRGAEGASSLSPEGSGRAASGLGRLEVAELPDPPRDRPDRRPLEPPLGLGRFNVVGPGSEPMTRMSSLPEE